MATLFINNPLILETNVSLGANYTGTIFSTLKHSSISISFIWTGNPKGSLTVTGSHSLAGPFSNINTLSPNGSADQSLLIIPVLYPHCRVIYTRQSGSGTLNYSIVFS